MPIRGKRGGKDKNRTRGKRDGIFTAMPKKKGARSFGGGGERENLSSKKREKERGGDAWTRKKGPRIRLVQQKQKKKIRRNAAMPKKGRAQNGTPLKGEGGVRLLTERKHEKKKKTVAKKGTDQYIKGGRGGKQKFYTKKDDFTRSRKNREKGRSREKVPVHVGGKEKGKKIRKDAAEVRKSLTAREEEETSAYVKRSKRNHSATRGNNIIATDVGKSQI